MSETQEQNQQDIVSLLKEYITTKLELARLSAIERLTVVVSSLITISCVVVAALLTFLFASLTLAFFLGELLDSYAAGFGIVALLYLVVAIVIAKTKEKYINKYLQDFIVKLIFNNKKK
ncbi:phage holin family protein [Pararcticibacter amylolyticus]|uniref:Phage holin family protein n=1 Tax=Pararcticibacter amylolyticus TaxID=2173175 RepID=A0A2U2PMA6_9SPHI|nr:phage holin family protein [Pararcticibacter amylolyticus]PWG82520.1 phage holin family protein [Pararcticibacter amylolyticus]